MSLLFNTLSRFVIVFLPRSNRLLISQLQSPPVCQAAMGPDAMILLLFFLMFSFKPALPLSSLTLIKRLFSSSSLSAIRVVSSIYLRLLMFPPPVLIPACNSSSPAFLMMCSADRLNKQADSREPCRTPFSTLNQSVVPYSLLTVAFWPAHRFLKGQVRWSGIPISLRAFQDTWTELKVHRLDCTCLAPISYFFKILSHIYILRKSSITQTT